MKKLARLDELDVELLRVVEATRETLARPERGGANTLERSQPSWTPHQFS